MKLEIRAARADEMEEFERFVGAAFGESPQFTQRVPPEYTLASLKMVR